MESALAAPIPGHVTSGDARVDHAELATQLAALHLQCFGWAMSCCGYRREDAEDVVQDVYLGVLDNGLRFNGQSSLRTWLFGVIRHKARARLRRDRLRALLGVTHAARIDAPAPAPAPDDHAMTTERRETMRRAIGELATRQREVLLLVFYHDLTIEEAARIMDVSLGSARVHYQRGKKRLARLLSEERP
jgi:RNA polymerase sigma factor (sigma-70 family)